STYGEREHTFQDLSQVVVLFALAWMDFHELVQAGDLLSIGIRNCVVDRSLSCWVVEDGLFIVGGLSCCLELSLGEEELLTLEVPALKNSSYKGPKRRSNS
ncbi:hypothetical protein Tco_0118497, partial [Tanacetum coccineum]